MQVHQKLKFKFQTHKHDHQDITKHWVDGVDTCILNWWCLSVDDIYNHQVQIDSILF
jgi:hypothetical protein